MLIVDDHVGVAESLASTLRDATRSIGVLAALPRLRAALQEAKRSEDAIDIVLLDLAVGPNNALEWLPELTESFEEVRFVIWTGYNEYALMEASLSGGARGFLVKSATIAEIRVAMDEAMADRIYRSPQVRRVAPSRASTAPPRLPGSDTLVRPSHRQKEILLLLRDGATMAAAAVVLGLHERTIEYHLGALRGKLGGVKLIRVMRWFEEYLAGEGR